MDHSYALGFTGSLAYPSATDNILASILYDDSPTVSKVAVFAYSVSLIYPLPGKGGWEGGGLGACMTHNLEPMTRAGHAPHNTIHNT